jgi:hypothetical protein
MRRGLISFNIQKIRPVTLPLEIDKADFLVIKVSLQNWILAHNAVAYVLVTNCKQ